MKQILRSTVILLIWGLTASMTALQAQEDPPGQYLNPMDVDAVEYLDRISLPAGFEISIYADDLDSPRQMALSDNGTLYVGSLGPFGQDPVGKVYAIRDTDGDYKADTVSIIAEGLRYPNGVALRDGALYVAEIGRILRFDDIEANLDDPPEPVVVTDDYPEDYHHGWKYIDFGPDGKLYVPVGAPCNACESEDDYSVITRINPDGSGKEVYARGIRNTVGFDWHPETGVFWFTDNGRDVWGHEIPPEELNRAPEPGLHFGYPYRYGKDLEDPEFETDKPASAFTPAALEMPAHTAPLGIEFYTGDQFPEEYKNQLFIARHGSWNRNPPHGYAVSLARIEDGEVVDFKDFATGWLMDEKHWGRPVDIELLPDGSMLVSDDHAGVIYRISYNQ